MPKVPKNFLDRMAGLLSKEQKFKAITKAKPMLDDYHLGIRSLDDIKDLNEVMDDFGNPDITKDLLENALKQDNIKVFSSKPIKVGSFVTPSRMMAKDYAGQGNVYELDLSPNDIGWINGDEGQVARVVKFEKPYTGKPLTREVILKANRYGLNNRDDFSSYHTTILDVAKDLGQQGVNLENQPSVVGFRYGLAPENGISRNYADDVSERGLSLVETTKNRANDSRRWHYDSFFGDRPKKLYRGIELPYKGSDGEPLILPYYFDDWDH